MCAFCSALVAADMHPAADILLLLLLPVCAGAQRSKRCN
jgi:hypothetical protein